MPLFSFVIIMHFKRSRKWTFLYRDLTARLHVSCLSRKISSTMFSMFLAVNLAAVLKNCIIKSWFKSRCAKTMSFSSFRSTSLNSSYIEANFSGKLLHLPISSECNTFHDNAAASTVWNDRAKEWNWPDEREYFDTSKVRRRVINRESRFCIYSASKYKKSIFKFYILYFVKM